MTVANREQAFIEANKLMNHDYEYNTQMSKNAGYDIYFTTFPGINEWISDLGTRLEVNLNNGKSVNIWIKPTMEQKLENDGFHKNFLGIWVH